MVVSRGALTLHGLAVAVPLFGSSSDDDREDGAPDSADGVGQTRT